LGVDYIMDSDGHAQFTRQYLLKQGYCCNAGCRYCPYLPQAPSAAQVDALAPVDFDRRSSVVMWPTSRRA
jgi:hypothetical protein